MKKATPKKAKGKAGNGKANGKGKQPTKLGAPQPARPTVQVARGGMRGGR